MRATLCLQKVLRQASAARQLSGAKQRRQLTMLLRNGSRLLSHQRALDPLLFVNVITFPPLYVGLFALR